MCFKKKEFKKDKLKKYDVRKIAIYTISFLVSAIGLILGFIFMKDKKDYFSSIAIGISLAIFQLGIISLLLGFFDRLDYAKNIVKEIMYEDKECLKLNEEKRENLKKALEESLYDCKDENSLYKVVQNKILPYTKSWYFEEYTSNIFVQKKGNKIIKNFQDILIINKSNEIKENIIIEWKDIIGDRLFVDNSDENNFDLKCVNIFRGKDVKTIDKKNIVKKPTNNSQYKSKYIISLGDDIILYDDEIKVELIYTSTVVNDNIYCKQVKKPCKSFYSCISYDDSIQDINLLNYGFIEANSNNYKNYQLNKNNKLINFKFNNWILPGEGFLFLINA